MKTDKYYLEMFVFGSITPVITALIIYLTSNYYFALIAASTVGFFMYNWIRKHTTIKRTK